MQPIQKQCQPCNRNVTRRNGNAAHDNLNASDPFVLAARDEEKAKNEFHPPPFPLGFKRCSRR